MNHGTVSKEIAKGLLALQAHIKAAKVPPSKLAEPLNIATWNICEFGEKRRLDAAVHYLAEILGQFDLITVVELRANLAAMARVMQILGPYWWLIYNDCMADPGTDARYDQIAHYAKDPERFARLGGTVDFYGQGAAIKELFPKGMTEDAFTYQMSDPLPLRIQINTDNDAQQLR